MAVGQIARVAGSVSDGRMAIYLGAATLEKTAAIGEFATGQFYTSTGWIGVGLDLIPKELADFLKTAGKYGTQVNYPYPPIERAKRPVGMSMQFLGEAAGHGRSIRDNSFAEARNASVRFASYANGEWSNQFAPWKP